MTNLPVEGDTGGRAARILARGAGGDKRRRGPANTYRISGI